MSRTGALLHRFEDPETSGDPLVRALVEKLSAVDYAPAPRPEFRSELRAQLVAIASRVVDEETEAARPAPVTKLEQPAARARRRVGRPLGLAAACCAVLALGLGGAVWKSSSALPGDSLYGLKRASENVRLSLASGDTARAHDYLDLATTRVQEAEDLLGRNSALASGSGVQAGGLSPETAALIRSTLSSADSDVTSGASLLGTRAVQSHSTSPLSVMTDWAPSQLDQLHQLATAIGVGPARTSTLHSWALVHSALVRARTLQPQIVSHCTASGTDALGPVGCSSATRRAPHPKRHTTVAPSHNTRPTKQHGSGHPAPTSHANTHAAPSPHNTRTRHANGGTGTSTTGPTPSLTPPHLPSLLPHSRPSLPDGCVASVQVGSIRVHFGSCPSGS